MVLRFLGVVFAALCLVGLGFHMNGERWVAITFYTGCGAIVVGIIVAVFRRYW